jgi:hypothetical protein
MPTQSPDWVRCICSYGPYRDASRLYDFTDGQRLILPMVRRTGVPQPLATQGSFPFAWGYGGVLARKPLQTDHLVQVLEDLDGQALRTTIFPNPCHGGVWSSALEVAGAARIERISRRAHVIDLHGGFEHVWTNRVASKARSGARKAEKHGVEARAYRGGEGVEAFYRLYLRSIDRWAERQHEPKWLAHRRAAHRDPLAKLQHIAGTLRDACRIWIAWRLGQPIAGTIVLIGRNADYILGAMDKCLAGPVNANDLLHARAIEEACHLGCGRYHMGESGQSSSLAQYKQRLGALAFDYEEVHLERLPLTRTDRVLRGAVKRILGFRDT